MGFLLPLLLLGGVLIAVTAQSGGGSAPGGIAIPPAMGPGDVINIVDPSERAAVWKALISTTSTAAQMDTLAAALLKEGYVTAAARATAKAASIRASSGGVVVKPPPGTPGGGVTIKPITPGNPFGLNPTPSPMFPVDPSGPSAGDFMPDPLRTYVMEFITNRGTDILGDMFKIPLIPDLTDISELVRVAYTYPGDFKTIHDYVVSWYPDWVMPPPPLPGNFIPNTDTPEPQAYFYKRSIDSGL